MRQGGEQPSDAVALIISPCTARKSHPPLVTARGLKLNAPGSAVRWIGRLRRAPLVAAASDLYRGAGFLMLREAANAAEIPFYVISAGLGLLSGEQRIPSYDLTFSSAATREGSSGSLSSPVRWWRAISRGPYSSSLKSVIRRNSEGMVLMALTKDYANAIGEELAALPPLGRARLRLFGTRLQSALPEELHAAIMPYDRRIDSLVSGARATRAHRSLAHFFRAATDGSLPSGPAEAHAAWVADQLRSVRMRGIPKRRRETDAFVRAFIARHIDTKPSPSALLQALRTQGIACEQDRLRRLVVEVRA